MSVKSEIVAGTPHSGDPGVLYLIYPSGPACTGTLIAPKVVLTARHCVEGESEPTHVGVGATRDAGSTYAAVAAVRKPTAGTWLDQDIALLILDAAGSSTPYPWGGTVVTGDRVIGIGYGHTERDAGDAGTKRRGESTIAAVEGNTFTSSGALGCYGDSGGPGFLDGRLAGVASRITNRASCAESVTIYMRVEAFRELIESTIAEAGGPGAGDPGGGDPGGGAPGGGAPGGDPTDTCMDTCPWAFDGECDDGGSGSLYAGCALGTDCADCGPRAGSDPGSSDAGGATCSDTCMWPADGECDDGGPGSLHAVCPEGTDCTDCGAR